MDDYLSEASSEKKYADKISWSSVLRLDYLNEESNPSYPAFRWELPLDYRIGSVHMPYSPER